MVINFEDFVSFVYLSHKALHLIKSYEIKEFGIKGYHMLVMHYLAKSEGGLSSGELCDKCKEDKAAVSRYLKKLYQKGYVVVEDNEEKKYKLKNILTDEGKKVYFELEKHLSKVTGALEKGISAKKLESFVKTLNVVANNFDAFCSERENRR